MEELRDLLKHTSDENTKKKILEMLQTWGMAFRNSPRYRIVTVSHISDLLPNKQDLENKLPFSISENWYQMLKMLLKMLSLVFIVFMVVFSSL